MGAEPARQDAPADAERPTIFQRSAKIIRFPKHEKESQEENTKPTTTTGENDTIPGDWASIITVWTDTPDPLCNILAQAKQARNGGTPQDIGLAIWTMVMLAPRGMLHLTSWLLSHPARFAAGAILIIIFIATL